MALQSELDLRVAERVPVNWQGAIILESRAEALDCAILDISSQGARITLHDAVRLPNRVKLRFARNGQIFDAVVAWQLGFDLGLRFSAAPSADATREAPFAA
jgi:hypothetical protein